MKTWRNCTVYGGAPSPNKNRRLEAAGPHQTAGFVLLVDLSSRTGIFILCQALFVTPRKFQTGDSESG